MPRFDINTEEITAFEIGDTYHFTMHFDEKQLFDQLRQYHKIDKYGFEIAEDSLEQTRQTLDGFFYDLVIEDSWEDYCVAAEKEADSSSILRNSVMREHRKRHEIFLMKDKLSVEQAVEQGATRLEKSGLTMEELMWKPGGS